MNQRRLWTSFSNLFTGRGRRHAKRRTHAWLRPCVVSLEDRILPSGNPFVYDAPAGQPLHATLRLDTTGEQLELVNTADTTVLHGQVLADTSNVEIGGSGSGDELRVDFTTPWAVPITFTEGTGATPADDALVVIGSSSETAAYQPSPDGTVPAAVEVGECAISFPALMQLTVEDVKALNFVAPGHQESLTLDSPEAGTGRIEGSNNGETFGAVSFTGVPRVTLDAATHATAAGSDTITLGSSGLTATGLEDVIIDTGSGTNHFVVEASDFSLPVAGGAVHFNGASGGTNTLEGPNEAVAWDLADSDAGTLTMDANGQDGAKGVIEFSHVHTLIGGTTASTFTVAESSNFAGTIEANAASDEVTIDLGPETSAITVTGSGSPTDTLNVNSPDSEDHLTDENGEVTSTAFPEAVITHSEFANVHTSVAEEVEGEVGSLLTSHGTGTYTIHLGNLELGEFVEAENVTLVFQNIMPSGSGYAGTVSINADSATLFPSAQAEPITAAASSLSATFDVATNQLSSVTARSLSVKVEDILDLESQGPRFTIDTVHNTFSASSPSLAATSPEFPGLTGTVTGLTIGNQGVSFTSAALSASSITLDDVLELTSPSLTVTGFHYTASTNQLAVTSAAITVSSASLFPGQDEFTATLDHFQASYSFATQNLTLSANSAEINAAGVATLEANTLTFQLNPFHVTVHDATVTLPEFGNISGGVSNLVITSDGFSAGSLEVSVPGKTTVGLFTFSGLDATLTNFGYSRELGAALTGTVTVSATSASFDLDGEQTLAATATGISGSLDLSPQEFGRFTFQAHTVHVGLGGFLTLDATDIAFNTRPATGEHLADFGSITATLSVGALSLTGSAQDFGITSTGALVAGDHFGISFQANSSTESELEWPSWLPVQITHLALHWTDFNSDPLNFTIELSAGVSIDQLDGSTVELSGFVHNAVIDVGLLNRRMFPVTSLGGVGIEVGGSLFGVDVRGQLFLDTLQTDANYHVVTDPTQAIHSYLYGGIDAELNLLDESGFEIRLGLSQLGPLQGYVQTIFPVVFGLVTGFALTDFRAGITFDSTLPDITDPRQMGTLPEFKTANQLTLPEWQSELQAAVLTQVRTVASGGNFWNVLTQPMTMEGGATIFNAYATGAAFQINGDFKFDTQGRFFIRGDLNLGGTLDLEATAFVDVAQFLQGRGSMNLFAQAPAQFPLLTIYGGVSFDFGSAFNAIKNLITTGPEAPNLGTALHLDGSDDAASATGIDLNASPSFTVEFWAQRLDQSRAETVLAQDGTNGQPGLQIGFDATNNFTFTYGNNVVSYAVHPDQAWHHYAVTFDASSGTALLYVDGAQVQEATGLKAPTGLSTTLRLGEQSSAGGRFFDGNVDEVRVWNTVRVGSDIQDTMSAPITDAGLLAELLGYWRFEDGQGSTAQDSSGHQHPLTLVGEDQAPGNYWVTGPHGAQPVSLGSFSMSLVGGMELSAGPVAGVYVDGSLSFNVVPTQLTLDMTVSGSLGLDPLGSLVQAAGNAHLAFESQMVAGVPVLVPEVWGAFALQTSNLQELASLGLDVNGTAVFRFNSDSQQHSASLTINGQSQPYTLPATSLSVVVSGEVDLEEDGTDWFHFGGVNNNPVFVATFVVASSGAQPITVNGQPLLGLDGNPIELPQYTFTLDALVDGSLVLGPKDDPFATLSVDGFLHVSSADGIAAQIDASADPNSLQALGVTMNASFFLELNTSGKQITYTVPADFVEPASNQHSTPGSTVTIPASPHDAAGDTASAEPYLIVHGSGQFEIESAFTLDGSFSLLVTPAELTASFNAEVQAGPIGGLNADGSLTIETDGIYGAVALMPAVPLGGTGFSIGGTFTLEVNTTGTDQSVALGSGSVLVPHGAVLVHVSDADLQLEAFGVDSFHLQDGTFNLTVNDGSTSLAVDAQLALFGTVQSVHGTAALFAPTSGDPGGLVLDVAVASGQPIDLGTGDFGISGSATLLVNTTPDSHNGIGANTFVLEIDNAQVGLPGFAASGSLSIGDNGGIFSIHVPASDPLTMNFLGLTTSLSGDLYSNGVFDLTASVSLFVGTHDINAHGALSITLSNAGLSGTLSGALHLGVDIGSASGTLSVSSSGEVDLTVSGQVWPFPPVSHTFVLGTLGSFTPNVLVSSFTAPDTTSVDSPVTATVVAGMPDLAGRLFTYTWTVTRNGSPFASMTQTASSDQNVSYTFTPTTPGTYLVNVDTQDVQSSKSASVSRQVVVNDVPPVVSSFVVPSSISLGTVPAFSAAATYVDSSPLTFHWTITGPGTSLTQSFTATSGQTVSYTPTLTSAGTYTVRLQVTDASGTSASIQTATLNVVVHGAFHTPAPVYDGTAFTAPLATFQDSDPNASPANLAATIYWGDHTTSLGTITSAGSGNFSVAGTHTYNVAAGNYSILVAISQSGSPLLSLSGPVRVAWLSTPTLTASASALTYLQPVTLTATVPGTGTAGVPTGTITFRDGTVSLGTVGLVNGRATLTTSSLPPGLHTITAAYSGDASYYDSSTASGTALQVHALSSVVVFGANAMAAGTSATYAVAVTSPQQVALKPGGTVTVRDGSTVVGTFPFTGGLASVPVTFATLGNHTLSATYSGDVDFLPSVSAGWAVSVGGTLMSVSPTAGQSAPQQPVSLTATLFAVSSLSPIPMGSVDFFDQTTNTDLGSQPLVASSFSSSATFTTSALTALGTHTIVATYGGQAGKYAANSQTLSQKIGLPNTTTLTTSAALIDYGQGITLTATVTAAGGTPTGSVDFVDTTTGQDLGRASLNGGSASLTTTALTGGTNTITATYSGDATYLSTTASLNQAVEAVPSATTLTSSLATAIATQPITFTATVSSIAPGAGIPTGPVDFVATQLDSQGNALGTLDLGTASLSGGVATLTSSGLGAGRWTVAAHYLGTASFLAGTSSSVAETLTQDGTTTALVATLDQLVYGQTVTFTATVAANAPGVGTPTGSVHFVAHFLDGAGNQLLDSSGQPITQDLGSALLDTTGTAVLQTAGVRAGIVTVVATYEGEGSFTSSSAAANCVVTKDGTSISNTQVNWPLTTVFPYAGETITVTSRVTSTGPNPHPTGLVDFVDATTGADLGQAAVQADGTATLTTSGLGVGPNTISDGSGTHLIQANFLGDSNFLASGPAGQEVRIMQDFATATLTDPGPSVHGQHSFLTATVAGSLPSSFAPTGQVEFFDNTRGSLGVFPLVNGTATLDSFTLAIGTYNISVIYQGDANFDSANSNYVTHVVSAAPTTMTMTATPASPGFWQSVVLTATVAAAPPGSGTPTGYVNFVDATTNRQLGSAALSGGTASLTSNPLAVGSHQIVATYYGPRAWDAFHGLNTAFDPPDNFQSTTATTTLTVGQDATTTTLTASAGAVNYSDSVSFTATIAPVHANGTSPTGTVDFYKGTTLLGSRPVVHLANGQDQATYAFVAGQVLGLGTSTLTAQYEGDGNFTGSTSSGAGVVVGQTVSSITPPAAPLLPEQLLTFLVTVRQTAGGGRPSDHSMSVTFSSPGHPSRTVNVLSDLSFSVTLDPGNWVVTANYAGDTEDLPSSATLELKVAYPATLSLSSSTQTAVSGQALDFTATVVGSGPAGLAPTGSVTFVASGTNLAGQPVTLNLGRASLDANGQASLSTSALGAGSYSVTAAYSGDESFFGASAGRSLSVAQDATGTTLTSSPAAAVFGQAVVLSATVTASTPGSGTPTGTVDFFDTTANQDLGTATLSGGTATLTTRALGVGASQIVATYSGDANFTAGSDVALPEVNPDDTTIALAATLVPSGSDTAVMVSATVSANAPGSGTPSGIVEFFDTTTGLSLGTASLDAGTASVTIPVSVPAAHRIVATYDGDSEFQRSNQSVTILAPTTTQLATSATPSLPGQAVTFTATVAAADPTLGTPAGNVDFVDQTTGKDLGLVVLAGGAASLTTGALGLGGHTIAATYNGSASFTPSTASLSQLVRQLATTTTLASSASPSTYSHPVTFTATITPQGTASVAPTGTVDFVNTTTGADLGSVSLSGGTASFTLDSLLPGSYTIRASYSGDAAFLTSSTSTIQDVQPTGTTTVVTSTNTSTVYGQAVQFTATVSANETGHGTPSGIVLFYDDNTLVDAELLSGGQATSRAMATLGAGTHVVTAAYQGTTSFAVSKGLLTQTVARAHLTIQAGDTVQVYGGAQPALTATLSGFQNGETLTTSGITGAPSLTTAPASSHVGHYAITVAAGTLAAGNYDFPAANFGNGTLTVLPAPLTIAANDASMVYGSPLPALTASYSGLVNGDTPASLPTASTLVPAATSTSHVGRYSIAAEGAADPDYTIGYQPGTLTITPASLTITADNQTKVYGAPLPTLTASYSGFVNGDTPASLATLPTLTTTATASSHLTGSPYAILVSGAAANDYTIRYVAGTLTVTPAPLRITADSQSKVYGAALPSLTASYNGFVNGDTPASLTTAPTLATTASASSHVAGGPYLITASGAVDADYAISYVAGILTVTPAALTITADNQTKVYGAPLPTLTASYRGLVNGDTPASLTTVPTLATSATASSHVASGPYTIAASGAADGDYTIRYVAGVLTVTPASLSITADNQTKVYGAALPALTSSYCGLINGDTPASLTTLPTLTTTATASSHVAGSPYAITASGAVDSDYAISYVAGTLNVTPAALTIAADKLTKVYGAALPGLTASYSGFVNGDTAASLATLPTLTTTATASSHVAGNPYAITVSGAVDSDYAISYVAGILTVTPAALTITADNQTKVYGAPLPTLTASYRGLVNGDTPAILTTPPALVTTASAASHVAGGPYTITASGAADADYSISYVAGALTVTPAALTISADSQTKVYGASLPVLAASYSGLVNGDGPTSLTTLPTLATTATAASHVAGGPYTITASGAVDSDYSISYGSGTLTITPAPLTITADNQTKVYGAPLPTLTASYRGLVNGDTSASLTTLPTLTTTASASSHVAGSPYAITASGAADADYSISYVAGALTVTPAPLTISADNQTKVYGAPLPTLTASYSGLVNGDTPANLTTTPSLTTSATAASSVGRYAITAGGAADGDYSISYAPGTLTITPAPLIVTANSLTKVYGQVVTFAGTEFTTSGLVNGDRVSTVTLTSSGAAAGATVAGGPYAIVPSSSVGSGLGNYTIRYVNGTLAVNPDGTTDTATAPSKSNLAQTVALTATLAANAPGSGTPTGTVDFYDTTTGIDLGRVALTNGKATLGTAALPVGSNSIALTYGGDGNFLASSTAVTVTIGSAIVVLDATASGALSMSGNTVLTENGPVTVDSSSPTALQLSGNAQLTATSLAVAGGYQRTGNAVFHPTPTTGAAAVADPLVGLASPAGGASMGAVTLGGSGKLTINPGVYSQITVSGQAALTLNPGVYVIAGGGLSVTGGATVTGSGVLIYNAGSAFPNPGGRFGAITISGNGTVTLTAPTTGAYAGIGVFQSRDNTLAMNLSGNALFGSSGAVYLPRAALVLGGNSNLSAPLLVDQLALSGNADPSPALPSRPAGATADDGDRGSLAGRLGRCPAPVAAAGAPMLLESAVVAGTPLPVVDPALSTPWALSSDDLLALAIAQRDAASHAGTTGNSGEEWASLFATDE